MDRSNNIHLLPLQGAYNVRDLGGYKTKDGLHVKTNKLFRSDDLDKLTKEDIQLLTNIPLRTIIDFREKDKLVNTPDKEISSVLKTVSLPINAGEIIDTKIDSAKDIPLVMIEAYKTIIRHYQDKLKIFFQLISEESNAPLLFHCSAGKDRTGITAALILAALGVDRDTIMEDYLLTNECLKGKYDFLIMIKPDLKPLFIVMPEYLEEAFKTIDLEYGGITNYLTEHLNVNIERLKALYTE